MNIRVRELPGIKAVPLSEPAEADLALINQHFSRHAVTVDDIHVRQARVAHNQHDRTLERFQKAHLERFAETLPGKSLLPGHNTSELPLGRWHRADTRGRTEEFPLLVPRKDAGEEGGEKAAEIVPGFEPTRRRVEWLEAAFYFTKDPGTELFRKNIDSGVYQDVSIGFSFDDIDCDVCKRSYLRSECPHWRGQKLEDGTLVTLTYSGDPKLYEARETSIVYLGAQQHAELTKQIREGRVDPEKLAQTPLGTDLVALKEFEAKAREHGHQQKSWAFPALKISLPVGGDEPPSVDGKDDNPASVDAQEKEHMKDLLKALGLAEDATEAAALAALKARDEAADSAKSAQAAAVTAKEAAEKSASDLKPLAEVGEKALTDLKDAYLAHCLRLGDGDAELAEKTALADGWVAQKAYDRLKQMVDAKFKAVCEKFPAEPSGDPSLREQNDPAPALRSDATAYQIV